MTGADLLDEAVDELYSADPEGFMARRQELALHAREAGQAPVAKQIAALRKPTRTAWVINQFARSDPDAITRLTELGTELRTAEHAGDGSRLRELSQTRRQLVATLVHRALERSGQEIPPAAMREEITATFAAALADAEVAEQLQQGTLVRAQRRSGFGTAQAPTLTVVPPLPDSHRTAKAKPKPKPKPSSILTPEPPANLTTSTPNFNPEPPANLSTTSTPNLTAATTATSFPATTDTTQAPAATAEAPATTAKARQPAVRAAEQKAEQQAAQQQRLAKARAKAGQALADADQAVAAAGQEQRDQEKTIRRLERELGMARSHLRAAAAEVRRAEAVQRRARQALDRLPKS